MSSFAEILMKNNKASKNVNINMLNSKVASIPETNNSQKLESTISQKSESTISQKSESTISSPKKSRISDAQYKKKLEKKASKKAEKEALDKELSEKFEEEERVASSYAQKAYDEEYTVAWIEESKPENAIKRAQKAYNKAYSAKLDSIRKPKDKIELVPVVNEDYLLEDSESDEELPPIEQKPFTEKKIIEILNLNDGFKLVKKRDFRQNQFAKKLESNKNEYINSILTENLLQSIEENFKNNQSMVINLKITDDTLESGDDYTITKSGFLKNKLFSKFLSRVIFKKLNKLSLYVDIKKIDDTYYNIILTDKLNKAG